MTRTTLNSKAASIGALAGLISVVGWTSTEKRENRSAQGSIAQQELRCAPQRPVPGRASPYDSVAVVAGRNRALICYSRPSSRGRTMIGGALVPFGQLWRTGANEPTTIHIPFTAEIAGIRVTPGSYSLYTVPNIDEWEIILNRSTAQWGVEGQYTDDIKAQEVGRGKVRTQSVADPIETFTISSVPSGANGADLVLEWERTRVRVPLKVVR